MSHCQVLASQQDDAIMGIRLAWPGRVYDRENGSEYLCPHSSHHEARVSWSSDLLAKISGC